MEHVSRYGKPKRGYETEEEARRVAEKMSRIYHEPLNAYCCAECNQWHVGRLNGYGIKETIQVKG